MPNYFDSTKIITGPASVLSSPRSTTPVTVTALAAPSPTATSFAVSAADAAKLRPGDRIGLASATPTYLADELSTMPYIVSISNAASPVITLNTALSGAPPTTAGGVRQVWINRGGTDGGVELAVKKDVTDQFIDQSLVAVGSTDQKLDVTLKAPMAEASLSNFALAGGLPDPTTPDELKVNSTDPSRTDRYAFVGPAPSGKTRYAVINSGKSKGTATHKADKDNKPIYALEVTAYADTTMTPDTLHIKDV